MRQNDNFAKFAIKNEQNLLLCLRVLTGKLRCESFQPLFLPLQPSLASPSPFQIVTYLDVQATQRFGFELDQIAVLERIQTAMIGSTGEHITRLERVNRADPLDTARNFMRHIAGIVI